VTVRRTSTGDERMNSTAAAYLFALVTWVLICAAYALARRSWVELAVTGFAVNLAVLALGALAPRAGVVAGYAVNGGFLLWFVVTVVRNVWLTRANTCSR
jgi:hypothetical protein